MLHPRPHHKNIPADNGVRFAIDKVISRAPPRDVEGEKVSVMPGDRARIPRNDIGQDDQLQAEAGARPDGSTLEAGEVVYDELIGWG
jgi:hypothetical protein